MQGAPKFEGKNPEMKKPEALNETHEIVGGFEQKLHDVEASKICQELDAEFFGENSVFASEMKDVYEALLEVCPLEKSK